MKKENAKRIALAAALVAVIGIGTSLAYFTDTDSKTNVVTLGNVNGTLNEEKDGKTLDVGEDGFEYKDIRPGDELDKQPFVTLGSDSQDAYVRVRVEVVNTGADKGITDEMKQDVLDGLSGTGANWVIGNKPAGAEGICKYYYYQTPLTKADPVTSRVFTTVTIPTKWENEAGDVSFQIKVTADLVQSANIDSELEKDASNNIIGWGSIDIKPAN